MSRVSLSLLALMLTLCGQRFEPVWTDFGGGVTRTPEWRRDVNEMGEASRQIVDMYTPETWAQTLADCIERVNPGACGHPEAELALVELARATGEGRYLALAKHMIAQSKQVLDWIPEQGVRHVLA